MRCASSALARGSGLLFLLAATLCSSPAWALSGPSPGAASAQTVKLPDGPASVHGLSDEASISVFSGQVDYSVPIDLPKGPAGSGPTLSLMYAGELGNGPVGIGWSIGSMSIRRSLRDGVPGYTDADELEITGIGSSGRLVSIATDEFRVEGQGNAMRIFRRGERFDVIDGDGNRYRLGTTSASREEEGGRISAWFADSLTSVEGQRVTFAYGKDQGEVYLEQIRWAPGDVYQVDLVYSGRRDRIIRYNTGFARTCARRLSRIDVFTAFSASRSRLRSYELSYDDETFPVSRLSAIRMFGTNASLSLPDLTFEYARREAPVSASLGGADGWMLNERGVSLADVDGDGAEDLLRLEAGNHTYKLNEGGRFGDAHRLTGADDVELETSRLMDLDGDSRPELVRIVDDTWRYYKLEGTAWTRQGTWPGTRGVPLQDPSTVLCDIDGDGSTDVVRGTTGGITVHFNSDSGLEAPRSLPRISKADSTLAPGDANVRFVDMNGDGLSDVVWLTDSWMKVLLGKGDGTFVLHDRIEYPWGTAAFEVSELQLADLNRDGLMDVVRFSAGHVTWYPGEANGRVSDRAIHLNRPENASSDAVVTIADANANGSRDIVWSSPRGMWLLDLAGPTAAGMLVGIQNGLGKTTRFEYASSASLSMKATAEGRSWVRKLPTNIPVVIGTTIDPGGGGPPRVRHYGVRDGFWDGIERRMGGFLLVVQKTIDADGPADTLVEETYFVEGLGDDRVLRGRESMSRLTNERGDLLETTRTTWATRTPTNLDQANPLLRKAVTTRVETLHSEGVASPIITLVEHSEFDAEARSTVEHEFGRIDRPGDERIVRRTYADDATKWIRDRLVEETVTEESGALVGATRTFYGAPTGAPLSLGQVGQGLVRRVDALLNPGNRWVTQSLQDYDACGNATTVTASGVTRVVTYDTRCLHPLAETITSVSSAVPLTWTVTWNEALVQPETLRDPNGNLKSVSYDTLARQVAMSMNGAPAYVHYVYNWTSPLPKTTAWVFDGSPAAFTLEGPTWPSGAHWRATTTVTNGASEALYTTVRIGSRFVIGNWKERDERGAVTRTVDMFYSNVAYPSAAPADARVRVTDHDVQGRVRSVTQPNGARKTIAYVALGQTLFNDELGPVSLELDGLDRVVHSERVTGTTTETVDAQYDAGGRIVAVSLQGGQAVHSFTYDTLGRLIHDRDPDIGARELIYDDRNLLVQHVNGAGQSVFFDYDGAGRLSRRGFTAVPDPDSDYLYVYDADASPMAPDCELASKLAAVTEPSGEVHFCYDVFGQQIGQARELAVPDAPPAGGSLRRTYSSSGFVLSELFDDGFSVDYRHDAVGRLVAISSEGANLWVADGLDDMDAQGRVLQERYGNNATEAYEYDALGFVSHVKVSQPSSTSLYEVTVTRNAFGAPKIVTDVDGQGLDQNATYGYDAAGRLSSSTLGTSGTSQFAFNYAYDALQNMTQRGVTGPQDIGVLKGTYKYGERGYGPRQLTSVIPGATP